MSDAKKALGKLTEWVKAKPETAAKAIVLGYAGWTIAGLSWLAVVLWK